MHRLTPLLLLVACDLSSVVEKPKTVEDLAAEKCPKVHLDRMEGDWLLASGGKADPKTRIRFVKDGSSYNAYYVGGFFTKVAMKGERREKDIQFTEIPNPKKQALIDKGEGTLTRLYVEPSFQTCALAVNRGKVDPKTDKEEVEPRAVEFVPFPEAEVVFSYREAQHELFLGDAAKDKKKADKELEELGAPKADSDQTPLPVGMWSKVEDDGDPGCTYDMDLYFNDELTDMVKIPAKEPKDGLRHWYHEWPADFEGNYHFEMYRYRTCGGDRQLIDVAATEATLY